MKESNIEIEIERTFLASKIPPEIDSIEPDRIHDVHILGDAGRPFLRLRNRGNKFEITKKLYLDKNDYSVQTEQTVPLDEGEFRALEKGNKLIVIKDRYKVPINGHVAEVDIFRGNLEGLVLIDFEFKSKEERDSFIPPNCCLAEVTQELFVDNGILAERGYKGIEPDLARFNYKFPESIKP